MSNSLSKYYKNFTNFRTICFLTIVIEGYVVLATELLAMRSIVSFVGTDTSIVAIIISAVLLPLAFGYYQGGLLYKKLAKKSSLVRIRARLIKNAILASVFLLFGLSQVVLVIFFLGLEKAGIDSRILKTSLYALIFLVTPVYLLGQTTPLISNYFNKQTVSTVAGKMLFASTMGSFFGAIFTTLFLMHYIGVHHTVVLTIIILAFLVILLGKKFVSSDNIIMALICYFAFILNGDRAMKSFGILSNNQYNTVIVKDVESEAEFDSRILSINGSMSSKYTKNPDKNFPYLIYIEDNILANLPKDKVNEVLILGAGGFTLGLNDKVNNYTYVDVDKALLEISERYFLKQKLSSNKKFIVEPARSFLRNNKNKYDVIILDAFSNNLTTPFQLVTHESFLDIKNHLNNEGVFTANIISVNNFSDDWSIKIDNTIRSVFSYVNRVPLGESSMWKNQQVNVMYTAVNGRKTSNVIYTDNKNGYFLDK